MDPHALGPGEPAGAEAPRGAARRLWPGSVALVILALAAAGCHPRANDLRVLPASQPTLAPVAGASVAPATAAPSSAPNAEPAAQATARPSSGGGGSGGSSGGPTPFSGVVRDEAELPLEGATVRLADGRSATTGPDGRFALSPPLRGPVTVSRDGYATSVVAVAAPLPDLHLRRADGGTEPFDQRSTVITGQVVWPDADRLGLAPSLVDTLDSRVVAEETASDESYALALTTRRAGEPEVAVFLLSFNNEGQFLLGFSPPFAPFADETPPPVTMVPADQQLDYTFTGAPALDRAETRLEYVQSGVPPIVALTDGALAGQMPAPDLSRFPGSFRLVAEAEDAAGDRSARVSVAAQDGATGAFLALPAPAYHAASRRLTWPTVSGAKGYRVEARPTGAGAPAYEAWTETTTCELPDLPWLAPGQAELTVEAVDGPDVGWRSVASARQLRVAPWERGLYRSSRTRVRP